MKKADYALIGLVLTGLAMGSSSIKIIWDASARITSIESNIVFLKQSQQRMEERFDKFIERSDGIRKSATYYP